MPFLGKNIKILRKKNKMSQKQLANECELTQATISRIELGQITNLSKDSLQKLAKVLSVNIDFLITGEQEKKLLKSLDLRAKAILENYFLLPIAKKKQLYDFSCFLQKQENNR